MDSAAFGRELYRNGKLLLDATRDAAVQSDPLRWARDDLDECLLDLKLAILDADDREISMRSVEAMQLIAHISILVAGLSDSTGGD